MKRGFAAESPRAVADLVDCFVEALVEIDEGSLGPEPGPELAAGDDVAGLFEQRRQDLERLVFQLDPDAVFPQLPRLRPDLKTPNRI